MIMFKLFNFFVVKTKLLNLINKDIKNVKKRILTIRTDKIKKDINFLFISDLHLDVVDNLDVFLILTKHDKYDFIIIGGDILDNGILNKKNIKLLNKFVKAMRKRTKKIYLVSGNHETEEIINILKKKKVSLLDSCTIEQNGILLNGIEYNGKPIKSDKTNKFRLVITHSPDSIIEANKELLNMDYALCGHTHGGQVKLFGKTPIKNCKDVRMVYGKWNINKNKGYTTSGLGCSSYPVRYNINPEIVMIKITN